MEKAFIVFILFGLSLVQSKTIIGCIKDVVTVIWKMRIKVQKCVSEKEKNHVLKDMDLIKKPLFVAFIHLILVTLMVAGIVIILASEISKL